VSGLKGRGFGVQVDASRLHPGFHFGQILGYDSSTLDKGPLFTVPVTVCVPDTNSSYGPSSAEGAIPSFVKYDSVEFTPGSIIRKFIAVPSGANFAELTVKSKNRNTTARFYTHIMQLQPVGVYFYGLTNRVLT
jgi:tripeptidyl-peptidase-2